MSVQPQLRLGRWVSEAGRRPVTLMQIFEELRERGYDGGYDAVGRCARLRAKERGQSTAAA